MDTRDLPSGRLVFFFSDVEGSTRLLTDLGDRYAPLLADHQRHVRTALAGHGGREISTEGDSFFAVFHAPLDGVVAAADVQRALASHPWPDGHPFRVRIGLHVGQAIVAGGDYVGIDVNRAARIAQAAHGGQTIVSDELAVEASAAMPAELSFHDLGRHRLKDIGVVHLWQLDVEGLPSRFGAPRTLEAHPTNLPAETTPLVDRETEAGQLQERIAEGPLVTVTGTGGIGKSRLAIAVARRVVPDFPDGVFYLDLASLDHVETAASELAMLIDVRVAPGDDPIAALVDRLLDRRALIVLETADRLPAIAAFIARIVEHCPTVRVLVTARSALHIRAEREVPIEPFSVPKTGAGPDAALESPAIEIFVGRARAISPAFDLSDSNVEAVTGIVRRLDGLPLAIELAAAATRILSPAGILDRLERSLPLPGGATVDAPERQRTIHETITWSVALLGPDERTMLARLSVFAGAFDLDGVMALSPATDGLETLGKLVDRSLVHRVGSGDDDRYRLLNVIRDFASRELEMAGDAESVRAWHAAHVLEVARRLAARLDGADQLAAIADLDAASDETRAVLEWSITRGGDARLGLELACVLGPAWYLHGRVREAAAWFDAVLVADPDAPPDLRATGLHWLGVMRDEQRDDAGATASLMEALAIWRLLGDERAIGRELNSLGAVQRNIGEREAAEAYLIESLMLRRRLGDPVGIATNLVNLGLLAIDRARIDEAIAYLEEAYALDRATGSTANVAYSACALGEAYLQAGRRGEAEPLLLTGLVTFQELEDPDGIAESLERIAEFERETAPGRSIRLLLAAAELRVREGVGLRRIDADHAADLVATVTSRLSAGELAAARADATAMDGDAAVAFAIAGREPDLRRA